MNTIFHLLFNFEYFWKSQQVGEQLDITLNHALIHTPGLTEVRLEGLTKIIDEKEGGGGL